jgi:hypothetical protein
MRIIGSPLIEFTASEFKTLVEKEVIKDVKLIDENEMDFWVGKMFNDRVYSEHFKKGSESL